MKLWLDDMRPEPAGWTRARTVEQAQEFLSTGEVEEASLDHDLGFQVDEEGNEIPYYRTGYDLVKWMAETGNWPKKRPTVHSSNPPGRRNMIATIDRYFPGGDECEP